jgi:hypothetical protein
VYNTNNSSVYNQPNTSPVYNQPNTSSVYNHPNDFPNTYNSDTSNTSSVKDDKSKTLTNKKKRKLHHSTQSNPEDEIDSSIIRTIQVPYTTCLVIQELYTAGIGHRFI